MKAKLKSIKAYGDTLDEVRKVVSNDARMTIQGFYDAAAKEKLKTIYEQSTGLPFRGKNNSETH